MTREPDNENHPTRGSEIEPPPIFGSWPRLYALVLFVLAADVALFYLVTRIFS